MRFKVLSSLRTPLGDTYLVELNGQRFIVIKEGESVRVLSELFPSEENLKTLKEGKLPPLVVDVKDPELRSFFLYNL